MGFTFGFTEDIEEDELDNQTNLGKNEEFINPIDNLSNIHQEPRIFTVEEMIQSIRNVRLTYEDVDIVDGMKLYRRELFDVRHQLMMEDNNVTNSENIEEFNILVGETDEDLKNGIYEGGLKSWECSFDMIEKLHSLKIVEKQFNGSNSGFNVIELGCGTSLPTLYILKMLFDNDSVLANSGRTINILLSDFNYDVLRLVTLPNILINWCLNVLSSQELLELQQREDTEGNIREGEIDVTEQIVVRFQQWLMSRDIQIKFISGSWSRQFMEMVHRETPNLSETANIVLTSETIYAPEILPVISEMLVELTNSNVNSVTLLGAKDIYFGVGGSIIECMNYLQTRDIAVTRTSIFGSLKRSVLSLSNVAKTV